MIKLQIEQFCELVVVALPALTSTKPMESFCRVAHKIQRMSEQEWKKLRTLKGRNYLLGDISRQINFWRWLKGNLYADRLVCMLRDDAFSEIIKGI